jgi:hypothetical protein
MHLRVRFVKTLNVDPITFDTDRVSNAKIHLKDQYEQKCFGGYFIEDVETIERLSHTAINRVGDISFGYVEVQFVALCFRYNVGDPIAGMEILNRSAILTGRPAAQLLPSIAPAAFSIDGGNESLGERQFVPVEILTVTHTPMQPQATALVRPLTCRLQEYVWEVSQPTSAAFAKDIEVVIDDLLVALADKARVLADDGKTTRAFFTKQLATFRGGKEIPLPAHFTPFPLTTSDEIAAWVAAMKPGTAWTRPLENEYDWAGVCQVSEGAVHSAYRRVAASPEVICSSIINSLAGATRVLSDLPRVYHTQALLESHVNIFMLMRRAQIAQ